MYNSSRTPNISHSNTPCHLVIYAHDAAYLIGFPELTTVEQVSENTEEFYEQKIKRIQGLTQPPSTCLGCSPKWE